MNIQKTYLRYCFFRTPSRADRQYTTSKYCLFTMMLPTNPFVDRLDGGNHQPVPKTLVERATVDRTAVDEFKKWISIKDCRMIPSRRNKTRQEHRQFLIPSTSGWCILFAGCLYWYGIIWRTQHFLEVYLASHDSLIDAMMPIDDGLQRPERFLYVKPLGGQGAGNGITGLLAAHLLAEEFGRILCVSTEYTDFLMAFQPINAAVVRSCAGFPTVEPEVNVSLELLNFFRAPNECKLVDILNSSIPVLYFTGNTYPRWPAVPKNFFFKYYRPTQALLSTLPWGTEPPHTVVHLRKGDDKNDERKGLDDETLDALGEMLPSDTFLITNEVQWFKRFEKKYSWRNSGWQTVHHSATIADSIEVDVIRNTLQLWSDWYTVLNAKRVLHTHSDFSISAIHWMDIKDTKSLNGVKSVPGQDKKVLDLLDESWRRDGETIPLRDRNRVNVSKTKDDMYLCDDPNLGFQ